MEFLEPQQRLYSAIARKRFGHPPLYGEKQYAFVFYGVDTIAILPFEYGMLAFGVDHYGDFIALSGIYRHRKYTGNSNIIHRRYIGSHFTEKMPYYISKNPRYLPQQANRQKMANAVAFYQGLTSEQKRVYYERAKGKNYTGYNLCLREHMLSH